MTHTKANKSKIFALFFNLIMYLSLILGIVFASSTFTVYAEGGTGTTGGLIIDDTIDITVPDGTYAYSATDKTLILNGYNGGVIRFTADNDVTVNLVNGSTNTITLNNGAVTEDQHGACMPHAILPLRARERSISTWISAVRVTKSPPNTAKNFTAYTPKA